MNEEPKKCKNTKLKIGLDILSVIFVGIFFMIGTWVYKFPPNPDERIMVWKVPLEIFILFVDFFPCLFGLFWLCFRHAESLFARFPILHKITDIILYVVCPIVLLFTIFARRFYKG